jgi:hypothetical protein
MDFINPCEYCAILVIQCLEHEHHDPFAEGETFDFTRPLDEVLCRLCQDFVESVKSVIFQVEAATELGVQTLQFKPNSWVLDEDVSKDERSMSYIVESKEFPNNSMYLTVKKAVLGGHLCKRAIFSSASGKSLAFEDRVVDVRSWIKECEGHETCKKAFLEKDHGYLPTRLIHLSTTAEGNQIVARLVSSSELNQQDHQHIKYTTVSHRWGIGDLGPLTTTRALEPIHRKEIDPAKIPKTFMDAFRVTLSIGVEYIWIDSLCILQDDALDWELESACMFEIYGGGFLNIAAMDAKDGSEGCYLDALKPSIGVDLSEKWLPFNIGFTEQPLRVYIRCGTSSPVRPASSLLNTRGWVFQEVTLPRRLLYCGRDQFWFQCKERSFSEDGTLFMASALHLTTLMVGKPGWRVNAEKWWLWAETMTNREFTVMSDRIPAMAGIVKMYQKVNSATSMTKREVMPSATLPQDRHDPEPVLGMWKERLPLDLGWKVFGWETMNRLFMPNCPSWTWISMHGKGLERPISFFSNPELVESARIIHVNVEWNATPLTSGIKSTKLVVESRFKKFKLMRMFERDDSVKIFRVKEKADEYVLTENSTVDSDSTISGSFFMALDEPSVHGLQVYGSQPSSEGEYLDQGLDVWCLALTIEDKKWYRLTETRFLILQADYRTPGTGGEVNQPAYKRIGAGHHQTKEARFPLMDAPKVIVELI